MIMESKKHLKCERREFNAERQLYYKKLRKEQKKKREQRKRQAACSVNKPKDVPHRLTAPGGTRKNQEDEMKADAVREAEQLVPEEKGTKRKECNDLPRGKRMVTAALRASKPPAKTSKSARKK